MTETIIIVGLLVMSLVSTWKWSNYKMALAVESTRADSYRALRVQDKERITALRQHIDLIRADARVEARIYMDRALAYEETISEKNRQISNMAERVASLKLVPGVEGGEDFHVEDVPPEKPYSPELQEWIDGLADAETRNAAHEFVEIRRRHGYFDEVILKDLEDSWTV
jgi:hypothetical protein